ncbi:protein translocase subunit SecF [Candidatus Uhrbacteria bacterium CG10_big_fil_rev_8_21_14_0_10_50_16]|uniref:Protein-export membrane protein SecF n=1 Tax=Candidatus Uhrbacteria bacterium CG10_big_fil_rev_8_21_14_0_10_50_16 TaxID=1975039 RepID=A0A2H0RMM2_9BACT|nr:MAG: protein translocase subunit SecF [Candidatus Uhrbacteria bacterium CG10_big_fil_rev_8_21_14_0_10_50_16]
MKIIQQRTVWFSISGGLILASIAFLVIFGLNLGIDFTGGSLLEVEYAQDRADITDIRTAVETAGFTSGQVQPSNERGLLVRQPPLTEDQHQVLMGTLLTFGELDELRFDSIGPVIGQELKQKSLWALVLIFVAIVAYVAWSFRKVGSKVKSWKYGFLTIVAALHDVLIALGVAALLGHFMDFSIGTAFVAALLTILGYSVNDTIVVFDRIRENLMKDHHTFEAVVDQSVNETIARSINTSLTTLLALFAVYLFGGETTKDFALILMVGIFVGAYSSIFIASPLLVTWQKWMDRKRS